VLSFFTDRLTDPISVAHAVNGVLGLLSLEQKVFEDADVRRVMLRLEEQNIRLFIELISSEAFFVS
jgi:hypothetical protein